MIRRSILFVNYVYRLAVQLLFVMLLWVGLFGCATQNTYRTDRSMSSSSLTDNESDSIKKEGVVTHPMQCISGLGNCFAIRIANQDVILITKENMQKVESLSKQLGHAITPPRWQLSRSVGTTEVFNLAIATTQSGEATLGAIASASVVVYPLQPFEENRLKENISLASSRTVSLNDLKEKQLPEGDYVLTVQYNGVRSWDQKSVYLEIR